jgi:hypothetical protein
MALTQPGATYKNQTHLARENRLLGEALDDIASQAAAARIQGNYGLTGPPAPPSSPSALQITAAPGLVTASVAHNDAPAGTQYVLQYSTTPNFQNPISEVLTHTPGITTTWQKSLPVGTRVYLRIGAKFPASTLGSWVYYGTSAAPTMASL